VVKINIKKSNIKYLTTEQYIAPPMPPKQNRSNFRDECPFVRDDNSGRGTRSDGAGIFFSPAGNPMST
jgi:hypothetical protein